MRFVGVKELKQKTMDLLKEAKNEDIIITAYGKPSAVLHSIDEDDMADYLIENDPEFKKKIEESWAEYLAVGGATAGELLERGQKRRAGKKI
jgi:prevent-host-death family protein